MHSAESVGSEIAFDHLIALRLAGCSSGLRRDQDIVIKDITGNEVAIFCPTRSMSSVEVASLTEHRLCAFLTESNVDCDDYAFKFDYLVLNQGNLENYRLNYQASSSVWGGFVHDEIDALPRQVTAATAELIARSDLKIPSLSHRRAASRALAQPYAFERYLKLYHMLELNFDYEFVQDIRGLDSDLNGFSKIISTYESNDLNRLKSMITRYCPYPDRLGRELQNLSQDFDRTYDILIRHRKEGSPFSVKDNEKLKTLFDNGGFTVSGLASIGVHGDKTADFIRTFASYVIYRVRCCVAHHKMGEYLVTDDDEPFLVQVAEPLLREVLCQVFSRRPPVTIPGAEELIAI